MTDYSDKNYWDKRYQETPGQTYDWLQEFGNLKPALDRAIQQITQNTKSPKILNVGCGNSILSEQIYDMGFTDIINIDISEVCILQMQERNKTRLDMKYQVMDVCEMSYDSSTFDWIIDKSTLDALMCADEGSIQVSRMLFEIQRVLKVGGLYQIISYGVPLQRLNHLTREFLYFDIIHEPLRRQLQWTEVTSKGEKQEYSQTLTHYEYSCVKRREQSQESQELFADTIKQLQEFSKKEKQIFPQNQEDNLDLKQNEMMQTLIDLEDKQNDDQFHNALIEELRDKEHLKPFLQELGLIFKE